MVHGEKHKDVGKGTTTVTECTSELGQEQTHPMLFVSHREIARLLKRLTSPMYILEPQLSFSDTL